MKVGIVTTFSQQGYDEYGHFLVDSLKKFLDKEVEVFLYLDNINLGSLPKNFHVIDFEKTVPEVVSFRNRNSHKPHKDFMEDAVRFSYKSYAWCHAGLTKPVDLLIWLDGDTELVTNISKKYLTDLVPTGYFTSFLHRPDLYTETGFLAWDLTHSYSDEFFKTYKEYYDTDSIYSLSAYTDCHVYDATRVKLENENKIKSFDLCPGITKNHFITRFKGYMVHYKGNRVKKRHKLLASAQRHIT